MPKRRGNSEGSIYQAKDGRWRAEVSIGYKRDGKPHRKILYGQTRTEVSSALKQILTDQQNGIDVAPIRQTVEQFLNYWLEEIVRTSNRERTYRSYEWIARFHVIPSLGRLSLTKLTPQALQRFLNERHKSGLSSTTIKHINATMRSALSEAMRKELVQRNVAKMVSLPRAKKYEPVFLRPDQARLLLQSVAGVPNEALFSVALALGLRRAEISGLRWQDIDFDGGTLHVANSLQRVKGQGVRLGELKSQGADRTLRMPQVCVSVLMRHKQRQDDARQWAGSKWQETDFVFASGIGTPLNPEKLTRDFKLALKVAGLPDMRLHDARHSCASLLLSQGVHAKMIQETLGHSNFQITMNLYSHAIPQLRNEVADKMDLILSPTKTPTKTAESDLNRIN